MHGQTHAQGATASKARTCCSKRAASGSESFIANGRKGGGSTSTPHSTPDPCVWEQASASPVHWQRCRGVMLRLCVGGLLKPACYVRISSRVLQAAHVYGPGSTPLEAMFFMQILLAPLLAPLCTLSSRSACMSGCKYLTVKPMGLAGNSSNSSDMDTCTQPESMSAIMRTSCTMRVCMRYAWPHSSEPARCSCATYLHVYTHGETTASWHAFSSYMQHA